MATAKTRRRVRTLLRRTAADIEPMRDDLLLELYSLKNDNGPRGRALDVQVEAIDKATTAMREALRALR